MMWFMLMLLRKFFRVEVLNIKEIRIQPSFLAHRVGKKKLEQKLDFYNQYNMLKETIIVDQDNWLIDGYTSYLIAKVNGIDEVSIYRLPRSDRHKAVRG